MVRSLPKSRKNCPKPRCAPKRRTCRSAIKYQKPGRVTSNGFLNFIREFQDMNYGLKPKVLVMRAARACGRLNARETTPSTSSPHDQVNNFRCQAACDQKRRVCN